MSIDYSIFAIPKGEKRKRAKDRERRHESDRQAQVRQYIFARERNLCRCCRFRAAESMHEVRPRGAGGKVSKRNSVAVCGKVVGEDRSCHTFLQLNQITVTYGPEGAEGTLTFTAHSELAATCMRVKVGESIESAPMSEVEAAL